MITSKDQFIQQREIEDLFEDAFTNEPNTERASERQVGYLESLLMSSVFDEEQRKNIEMNFECLTVEEATKLIEYLQDNQQDKFTQSSNYSITELYARVIKLGKNG